MTNFYRDFNFKQENKKNKNDLNKAIFASLLLLVFMVLAGMTNITHADYVNTNDQTITPKYECYVWNGAYCIKLANHTQAFWNCSKYYDLPCGENGELLPSIPYTWASEIWQGEENGDVNLTVFEMVYLMNHITE